MKGLPRGRCIRAKPEFDHMREADPQASVGDTEGSPGPPSGSEIG